jgi:AraC-like DNA-binding protein
MSQKLYVATTAAKPLISVAEQAGIARATLLGLLGATERMLQDPAEQTPMHRYLRLWEHVARTLKDPALPVKVAQTVQVEDYHLAGFAAMTSANGREMIRRLQRYSRLHTNSDRWMLEERADEAVLHLSHAPALLGLGGLGYRLVKECLFAKLTSIVRRIDNPDFVPRWVHFRHAAPADTRPLRRFLGTTPNFGAERDAVAFEPSFLSRGLKTANRAFNEHFVTEAEKRLESLGTSTEVAERVRKELVLLVPSGGQTMADVARRLMMTERTLRRHLELEGTTFRELVNEVRRTWAPEFLRSANSVGEVALMLGFNDISAFGRAFKRWYGVSPRVARSACGRNKSGLADSEQPLSSRDKSFQKR